MNPKPECFDKPIWTAGALLRALAGMPNHLRRVLPTVAGQILSNRFRERLMLAVTAENRCPYCKQVHTAVARLSGLSPQEIQATLEAQDETLPEGERLAVVFVRDLARRGFQSRDEELYRKLGAHFSESERAAIESTAHVINLANRLGNTFDFTRALFTGPCQEDRNALWEEVSQTARFIIGAAGIGMVLGPMMVLQWART